MSIDWQRLLNRDLQSKEGQEAEVAIPKTLRDYLSPLNLLVFPTVAVFVWFWGIPWLQSVGWMATYTAVWYLSITTLSVFFSIWLYQRLDEWSNGPRNIKVQAKRIEMELLRQQEGDKY